jgi:hypothetical protein
MKEEIINIEKTIQEKVKEISDKFMDFSKILDSENQKYFNSLFMKFLEFTQFVNHELTKVSDSTELYETN